MPTKKEVIKKYGKPMWDKMCATTWLDCITVTIKRALCECKCEKCGAVKNICVDPYDSHARFNCDCGRWNGMHVGKIIKMESDIPASDIDRAYRAANGGHVSYLEWD
jgi:hypothetical protein